GTVLAVEAFEGTNEAIKRGGGLGKGEAMMVKVSKPRQDFRFDVPVVGPATIETAAASGVNAIVVEAGCTLLLGKDDIFRLCREKKVSLVARAEA
ncbi:MAG: UDP-2,3-diacylglucosamine diphosphatase LpxI, partial [Verrucomicrobia bacterium]|nr:UDP-2,3-diacylglucosamine diphosphatase LpxI [Verrucomicrobiota bacterium]